ncbi:dihydropteroate synthase [bacterium C-53]|nr:dihydropteroate synthase [Lachnospiraceae bacterium]NBI03968.1 dihydropteroate synthase [Lachnospiraceae bacterium]RKJ08906.1 dihydropteroate synthase [bacterium C-53]
MIIGNREFQTSGKTYVMGILNVTPDSFSDGGEHNTIDSALFHAEKMMAEGADIIDVGGESTRPGFCPVSEEEEMERVCPVIEKIRQKFDIPVSVDTYKSSVAEAALASGAHLVNDVWGLKHDGRMAEVIADAGAACCLMHNRKEAVYRDFLADVKRDMEESLAIARRAGIREDRIIVDPGVGFAKSYEQNLLAIRYLKECMPDSYPILLGTSRKSVIGLTLDLPAGERVEGTLVTTVLAVQQGAMFVRVHDIKENVRAIRMTEALYGSDQN